MSATFTPGPWRTGLWMGDKTRAHVVDMGQPPTAPFAMLRPAVGPYPASAIIHSDGDRCELEANARLIAAAPRLHELVEESLYHLRLDSRARAYHEKALATLAEIRGGQ